MSIDGVLTNKTSALRAAARGLVAGEGSRTHAPAAAHRDGSNAHDDAQLPAFRIRPTRPDFRHRQQPLRMDGRTRLMHRIAWLDAALSAMGDLLSPAHKRIVLSTCSDILDAADSDDRLFIAQAVHCLMRKHGVQPGARGRQPPER